MKVKTNKTAFMLGALLLALAITGGVFAYGYVSYSTSITGTAAESDFANLTVNTTAPQPDFDGDVYGLFKGTITGGNLFDIDTDNSTYPGDFVATVSIANGDALVKAFRVMALLIEVRNSAGNLVDINGDSANNSADVALLTLSNGSVDLFVTQTGPDFYTVKLQSGFYVSHLWGAGGWGAGYSTEPLLYCDIAQK